MEAPSWTRDELLAHVDGAQVLMRTVSGANFEVPAWILEASGGLNENDSIESLVATHPEDRGPLVDSFTTATRTPGHVVEVHIRVFLFEMWLHADVTWVDLSHQPDVGGLLCTVRVVDGPPIDPPPPPVLETVHAATHWTILVLDERGVILGVRGSLARILGRDEADVLGRYATDFIHPDSISGAVENWIELQERPEQTRSSRQVWVRADGSSVWLESSFLVHPDGSVEMVIVDVDARVADEAALDRSRSELAALAEDFRLVADEVPLPVFRSDDSGRVDFRNAQWSEAFPDQTVNDLHQIVHPDWHGALDGFLATPPDARSRSIELLAADGARMLSIRGRGVGDDAVRRVVGSITDITAALELHHRATHDALTGLPNRTQILSVLDEAIAEDAEGTLVLFLDLDGFKEVNDTYGHDAGDLVLVEVGRRLAQAVRPGDDVGRYGGDEFVVVCRGASRTAGRLVADRLSEGALGRPIAIGDATWEPAASIGWARPAPGESASAILRRADTAMFEVKRTRRRRGGGGTLGR